MKSRFTIWFLVSILLSLGLIVSLKVLGLQTILTTTTDEKSASNEVFKIRIVEKPVFFMQFQYEFQAAKINSDSWNTIKIILQDDPFPIDSNSMGIVGKDIGYFAFGNIYALTKDSGEDWSFFDFTKQTKFGMKNGYVTPIKSININQNGSGRMHLEESRKFENLPVFITSDFGETWNEERRD